MIHIGSTEIETIHIGSSPSGTIYWGISPVWPTNYHFVLTLKSVSYSSSSNNVHATGNDYAVFTCYYSKVNSSTGTTMSITEVTATPAAMYFTTDSNNRLYYDYDNAKSETVAGTSTYLATLTYMGLSISATFAFAGNSKTTTSSITPIVLDSSVAAAGGSNITYTGGDVTTTNRWSSGYSETSTPTAANFTNASANSQSSTTSGYIVAYTKTVYIPSLENHTTSGQSYYTFTSDQYNGTTVSVTVYQAENAMHTNNPRYAFCNYTDYTEYSSTLTLPASPSGSFTVCLQYIRSYSYDSGYSGGQTKTIQSNTSYTMLNQAALGGGCISASPIGGEGWDCIYGQNTSGSMKISVLLAQELNGTNILASLTVQQMY